MILKAANVVIRLRIVTDRSFRNGRIMESDYCCGGRNKPLPYSHDLFTIEYANELNARGNRNNVLHNIVRVQYCSQYKLQFRNVDSRTESIRYRFPLCALLKQWFSVSIIGHTAWYSYYSDSFGTTQSADYNNTCKVRRLVNHFRAREIPTRMSWKLSAHLWLNISNFCCFFGFIGFRLI